MTTSTSTSTSPPPPSSSTFSLSSPLYTSSSPSSYFTSLARRRQQKKMSVTQTYYLAHTARKKLTREASRADHDLRLLVGHANLLDNLMLDLADAEQEQERWFNQTVSGVTKGAPQSERRHIQWADSLVEEPEEDWDPEDVSDADSDLSDDSDDLSDDDDDYELNENFTPVRRRAPSPVAIVTEKEVTAEDETDSDSEFEYEDEDLSELTLTRSPSRQSPPELLSDSDGESEDDAMPPSPPQPTLQFGQEKTPQTTEMPLSDAGFEPGYYVASPPQGPVIESY